MKRADLDILREWFRERDEELARLRAKRRAAYDLLRSEVPALCRLSDAAIGNAVRYLQTTGVVQHWKGQRGNKQMLLFV